MTLKLHLLPGKRHATIVTAYAQTMTDPDAVKDKFYEEVHVIAFCLISLGIEHCNSNSLLLQMCAEH